MSERKVIPSDEFSRRRGTPPKPDELRDINEAKTLSFMEFLPLLVALVLVVAFSYYAIKYLLPVL